QGGVECFYDKDNAVIYLHLQSLYDVQRTASACQRLVKETKQEDFLSIWQREEYRHAKTLLWMFSVSHIVLLSHPGCSFDLSYVRLFRTLDTIRVKLQQCLLDQLQTIPGVTKNWMYSGRPCAPRVLFVFESALVSTEAEEEDRGAISKVKKTSPIKKLQHSIEDQIYRILRKSRIITNISNNSLFAVPANQEFVYIHTSVPMATDPVSFYLKLMRESSPFITDKDSTRSREFQADSLAGRERSRSSELISRPPISSFKDFLWQHIELALGRGFDDNVGRNPVPPIFEVVTPQLWFAVATQLYNFFFSEPIISKSQGHFNTLKSLLETDLRFSENRCNKVVPVAEAAYQDGLPTHYITDFHLSKVCILVLSSIHDFCSRCNKVVPVAEAAYRDGLPTHYITDFHLSKVCILVLSSIHDFCSRCNKVETIAEAAYQDGLPTHYITDFHLSKVCILVLSSIHDFCSRCNKVVPVAEAAYQDGLPTHYITDFHLSKVCILVLSSIHDFCSRCNKVVPVAEAAYQDGLPTHYITDFHLSKVHVCILVLSSIHDFCSRCNKVVPVAEAAYQDGLPTHYITDFHLSKVCILVLSSIHDFCSRCNKVVPVAEAAYQDGLPTHYITDFHLSKVCILVLSSIHDFCSRCNKVVPVAEAAYQDGLPTHYITDFHLSKVCIPVLLSIHDFCSRCNKVVPVAEAAYQDGLPTHYITDFHLSKVCILVLLSIHDFCSRCNKVVPVAEAAYQDGLPTHYITDFHLSKVCIPVLSSIHDFCSRCNKVVPVAEAAYQDGLPSHYITDFHLSKVCILVLLSIHDFCSRCNKVVPVAEAAYQDGLPTHYITDFHLSKVCILVLLSIHDFCSRCNKVVPVAEAAYQDGLPTHYITDFHLSKVCILVLLSIHDFCSRCNKVVPVAEAAYQDGLPTHYITDFHLSKVCILVLSSIHDFCSRCNKVVPVAEAAYQDGLPTHYITDFHLSKVCILVLSSIHDFCSRCNKVVPVAEAAYQDGLPTHYITDFHLSKVCILVLSSIHYFCSRCNKVVPVAEVAYQDGLPTHYITDFHLSKLEQAKRVFYQFARGPACEKYVRQLEQACERFWKNGRQLCEEISITGNHCINPLHRLPDDHDSLDNPNLPIMHHSSQLKSKAACNCGRKQVDKDDPFDHKYANHDFYKAIEKDCCDALEHIELPIFKPSTPEAIAADAVFKVPALKAVKDNGSKEETSTKEIETGMGSLSLALSLGQTAGSDYMNPHGGESGASFTTEHHLEASHPSQGAERGDHSVTDQDHKDTSSGPEHGQDNASGPEQGQEQSGPEHGQEQSGPEQGEESSGPDRAQEHTQATSQEGGPVTAQSKTEAVSQVPSKDPEQGKEEKKKDQVFEGQKTELDPNASPFRQHSTTEYLIWMINTESPQNLLPKFPSWSICSLGKAGSYNHNTGLDLPGFLHGSNFLLPWDITVKAEKDKWPSIGETTSRRGRQKKTNREVGDLNLRIYLGNEYECPRGHRFFCSGPEKVIKVSSNSTVKDNATKLTTMDMPLYCHCPHCRSTKGYVAQLMRLYIVTPEGPARVSVDPQVQPGLPPSPVFTMGFEKPLELPPGGLWVVRLPYPFVIF
ncbi:hypothetical protein FSP39_006005, partial [Pinctada imbricata]